MAGPKPPVPGPKRRGPPPIVPLAGPLAQKPFAPIFAWSCSAVVASARKAAEGEAAEA